jgi:hypothetical protein
MTNGRRRLLIVAMIVGGGLIPVCAYCVAFNVEAMAHAFQDPSPTSYRISPWHEQWSLFLTGYVVKPAYMLLTAIFIIVLRRCAAPDLVALWWGLLFFLLGEVACAVNYLVFTHGSYLAEFLHSYGMVVAFAFMTYAGLEGVDGRVLHVSARGKKCALASLCTVCGKNSGAPCGLQRIFKFSIAALIVTSLIAFCARPTMVSYDSKVLLTPFNFSHPVIYQLFEIRYCPVLAIVLFALSYLALVRSKDDALQVPKILFSAGMGAFLFGMFRLVLFQMFANDLAWFNSWEEIMELVLIVGVGFVLHVFRQALLERNTSDAPV